MGQLAMIVLLLACTPPQASWLEQAAALQHARCTTEPAWTEGYGLSVFEGYTLHLDEGVGQVWWSIRSSPSLVRRIEDDSENAESAAACDAHGLTTFQRVESSIETAEFALELRTTFISEQTSCPISRAYRWPLQREPTTDRIERFHLERDTIDPSVLYVRATSGRHIATGVEEGDVMTLGTANASCAGLGPEPW